MNRSADQKYGCALWLGCVVVCLALFGQGCGTLICPADGGKTSSSIGDDGSACSPPLVAALVTDRYQVYGADGPEGQATLRAIPLGGEPPFTFQWHVLDPAAENADFLLDAPESDSPRFTAGELEGPFDAFCTVIDARGCSFTDKLVLTVGTPVGLDLTTERYAVAAGGGEHGGTTLHLTPFGGPAPYKVSWMVTGPDGNLDNERLDVSDPLAPRFTSSTDVGTYVVTGAIVDAAGASSIESIIVIVGQHLGLDVVSSPAAVVPGGGNSGRATLIATPIGGKEPYLYDWDVVGPEGQPADEFLNDATLRSPVFESGEVSGYFLARCTVTDADGNVMIGSTVVVVGQQLTVDLIADRLMVVPGGGAGSQASLSADVRGGRTPLTITWSITAPDGQIDNAQLDIEGIAPDAGTFDVTFTSTEVVGTFVVRCVVVDADGVSAGDSLRLSVRSPLSLDVTADRIFVPPLTANSPITVTAAPLGGESPYDYAWSATGGTLVDAAVQTALTGQATNRWWASTPATYTISCTATDSAGQSVKHSVTIVVDATEPLGLDVTAQAAVVYAGGVVTLFADRTAGSPNFTYTWDVLDESGGTAGTLGLVTQTGVADDTTNTWTAPTGSAAQGVYRIRCTVVDALGVSATDTVSIEVSTLSVQNVFLAPAAADTGSVLAAIFIASTAEAPNPDPGHQIFPADGLTNPIHPRGVVVAIVDANNSIAGGTARVTGLDARGQTQSEIITIAASAGGFSLNAGIVPFATVTEVNLFSFSGITAFTDLVAIGVGDKFGLTGILDSVSDILYVKEGTTVRTADYTVDATAGQQGITFAAAPNGATDYTVVFRSR